MRSHAAQGVSAVAIAVVLAGAYPRGAAAQEPIAATDAVGWRRGAVTTLFEPGAGERGSFPVGVSIDVVGPRGRTHRRAFVGVMQNPDDAAAELQYAYLVSDDGGASFGRASAEVLPEVTNFAQLPDGSLIDVSFKAVSLGAPGATLRIRRSLDAGVTWSADTASLSTPQPLGGFRLHRGISVLADGTLLTPAYLGYVGESAHGVRLLESTDGGASWAVRATIAGPTGNRGYNETSIAQTRDGSLLAVMRTEAPDGHGPLMQSRSQDAGLTWSAPREVMVAFGDDAGPRVGVDPALLLLPNGVLVLSGGRPDNWLAVDPEGIGESFAQARVTYVNVPGSPASASQYHGSSGYSALVELGSNRLLLVGDNCANSWGCPANEGAWTVDGKARIWQAAVDVVGPDVGKIDIAAGLAEGRYTLDGTMTWTDAAHPEAGPRAAFDGSIAPWSSAIADGDDDPQLVLELDRIHELTRIGLLLRRGLPASASIYVSEDGDAWGEPIVVADAQVDHALAYVELDPPVRAGWIRVVGVGNDECAAPLHDGCAVLGELELYSTIDGFENDAIAAVPRGFHDGAGASVEFDDDADPDHDGGRVLRIRDDSSEVHASIARRTTPSDGKRLELRVRADALPNAMLLDVLGTDAAGDEVAAYHLAWTAAGTLRRYDAAAAQWSDVAGPGLADPSAWTTLRVLARHDGATLCVDGAPVAEITPSTAGVVELVGFGFASAGTAPVGDVLSIDDVLFDDAVDGGCAIERPRQPPTDEPGTGSSGGDDGGTAGGVTATAGDSGDGDGGTGGTGGGTAAEHDANAGACACTTGPTGAGAVAWWCMLLAARRRRR